MEDPGRLRISDQDRHTVAEVLRQAAGEGRIDLEELDERLEAAYQAKTYGELVPITADLPVAPVRHPVPAPRPAPVPPTGPGHTSSVAVMGEVKIIVNAGTTVVVEGIGVMGEFSEARAKVPFDPAQGGPVVRVRGL